MGKNQFPGLARGPIDHNASSVINMIANEAITMGDVIQLFDVTSENPNELLPRAQVPNSPAIDDSTYGIAVGGDADGVYGDGQIAVSGSEGDINRATTAGGQGIVVVTQGRCLARVFGGGSGITVGLLLSQATLKGVLEKAIPTSIVIARALQPVAASETDMIAVDIQREGELTTAQ